MKKKSKNKRELRIFLCVVLVLLLCVGCFFMGKAFRDSASIDNGLTISSGDTQVVMLDGLFRSEREDSKESYIALFSDGGCSYSGWIKSIYAHDGIDDDFYKKDERCSYVYDAKTSEGVITLRDYPCSLESDICTNPITIIFTTPNYSASNRLIVGEYVYWITS